MKLSMPLCDPLSGWFFAGCFDFQNVGAGRFFLRPVSRLSLPPQMRSVTCQGGHIENHSGQGFEPLVTCDPLLIKLMRLIYKEGLYIFTHICLRKRGVTGHRAPRKPEKRRNKTAALMLRVWGFGVGLASPTLARTHTELEE